MTGNQNRNRIRTDRPANRARGIRSPKPHGDIPVIQGFSRRDLQQYFPHPQLKSRPVKIKRFVLSLQTTVNGFIRDKNRLREMNAHSCLAHRTIPVRSESDPANPAIRSPGQNQAVERIIPAVTNGKFLPSSLASFRKNGFDDSNHKNI